MRILVRVDDDCIKNATPKSSYNCALSVAIREATGFEIVWLVGGRIYFRNGDAPVKSVPMSKTVKRAVTDFDFEHLEPFAFYLDLP